jgi:hypothetical protein
MMNHLCEKDSIIDDLRRELTDFKNTNFTSIMQQSPIAANNSMMTSKDFHCDFNAMAAQRSYSPRFAIDNKSVKSRMSPSPVYDSHRFGQRHNNNDRSMMHRS